MRDKGASMLNRFTMARAGAAAVAAVMALAATAAQAQPYGYNGAGSSGYAYDACKREKTGRGTVGALIGGTIGAVIGSNAAARNARTEGSLLGGALGAAIGAGVGNASAACTSNGAPSTAGLPVLEPEHGPPPMAAYTPPPPPPPPSYYERDAYAAEREASDDARPMPSRGPPPAGGEDCTLAESPIFMPDGRTQTRFVRVCRDATGKYAVVD